MRQAADRISQLPRSKRIVVFGDEDVDGVTSVIIIGDSLRRMGFSKVESLFCLHEQEGHGFGLPALDFIDREEAPLLILVDLGISNDKAVKAARDRGFEVVIIDHHEPLSDRLPPANFIINPKQPGDSYFNQLAAAGLCYHFSRWLLWEDPDFDVLESRFVELAGLATLADMMTLEEDNLTIVNRFLAGLPQTTNPSLRYMLERYLAEGATLREAVNRIISTLNASQVNRLRLAESFLLLTEDRPAEISRMVDLFEKRVAEHIALRESIISEAEQRLREEELPEIIFIGDENWPRRSLASVAARLSDLHQRPVFAYHQGEESSRGSARSPEGFDCVALMKGCADLFVNYGGHPAAAGFEVRNGNLQKLRICLLDNYRQLYG